MFARKSAYTCIKVLIYGDFVFGEYSKFANLGKIVSLLRKRKKKQLLVYGNYKKYFNEPSVNVRM